LTRHCVVALIDHQAKCCLEQQFRRQGIINNTVALGKAARVFDVPVVLTTLRRSPSAEYVAAVASRIPGQEPIERSSMNSWEDKNFVAGNRKSGRKRFSLPAFGQKSGVRFRQCRRFMTATRSTFVEDCCGDVSQLAHDNAMKRVVQAAQSRSRPCRSCSNGSVTGSRGTTMR